MREGGGCAWTLLQPLIFYSSAGVYFVSVDKGGFGGALTLTPFVRCKGCDPVVSYTSKKDGFSLQQMRGLRSTSLTSFSVSCSVASELSPAKPSRVKPPKIHTKPGLRGRTLSDPIKLLVSHL